MKIERTQNASRNIVNGVLLKICQIIAPFLMRTAMIYFIGVQYLGLNSLFTSLLQVLNLAELGVGSAMIYSMYKPIVENDTDKICRLLSLYRSYYNVIGLVIAGLGIAIMPFLPGLIRGEVPADTNIYILYLFNLSATVLSYWLLAYKNSILYAHQRVDITSKVLLFTSIVQYAMQFIVLWLFRDYYLYVIVALMCQILSNVITAMVTTRMYPVYKPKGKLDKKERKEINGRIRDLFTSKIGAVIVNSADTIVISAFLGLTVLAVYQNYFLIITSVSGIVGVIYSSCAAGIGNSLIVETKEKNYNDLKKFTFLLAWLDGFCASCFLCLFQPFMEIWMGEKLQMSFGVVICLVIYFFVSEINRLLNTYKDAGGIWHEDRLRPLVTAAVNLILNLVMVQLCGIYGVILSTVLSMLLVGMPWLFCNLFTILFEKKYLWDYLKQLTVYVFISFAACFISYVVCSFVNWGDWQTLFVRLAICCVVPNVIFFMVYYRLSVFKESIILLRRMVNRKGNQLKIEENDTADLFCYAAAAKDERIRRSSSSGGVFYEISSFVIENQGVVFGAKYDENWNVVHGHTETESGIREFLGSKYVQSALGRSYIEAEKYLKEGRLVLFSGTPCQISGLKHYLGLEYSKLVTVDFICHGVPSPAVWRKYLEFRKADDKIRRINFRDKTEGWRMYSLKLEFENRSEYRKKQTEDLYMRGFLQDIYLRPSCYTCRFKGIDRDSDITLGDYWGVWEDMPLLFDDKGTSLVFLHTSAGEKIWEKIRGNLKLEMIDSRKPLLHNPSAYHSVEYPKKRDEFFANDTGDFDLLTRLTKESCFAKARRRVKQKFKKISGCS